MSAEGQIELVGSEIERLDIAAIIRARLETEFDWTVIEEYPNSMVLGPNMRERSDELVEELVKSIASVGQMQECNGDQLEDETIRVITGQHRFWAVEFINELLVSHNLQNPENPVGHMKLRVRVADKKLSPYEMLDLQIAENLHLDLKPEEEAEKIAELFSFYRKVVGEEATVADFSRRVSRGETKVRNALKFMELDEKVREMVEEEIIHYSVATKLARVPAEKQFNVATKIVLYNLSGERVDTLIKSTIGEEDIPSIFSEEIQAGLDTVNYRLALRGAADRAARDAAGYFKRVLYILDIVDEVEKVTMTDTIRDVLSEFIIASDEFKIELEKKAPHLWEILKERVIELKTKFKRIS